MHGPGAIRLSASIACGLLAVYQLLRLAAKACSGAQCDNYIPISLIVPVAILVAVAVTGWIAISQARLERSPWAMVLWAATAVGVVGPVAAAAVLRDQPDILVPVAMALFLATPLAALLFSRRSAPQPR